MDISIYSHSLSDIQLTWKCDGSKDYYIKILDFNKTIIINAITKECMYSKIHKFNTGQYTIYVNKFKIYSIVPAICRLSTGGCGTLISGSSLGLNKPLILTANHCIPTAEIAKQSIAHFENHSLLLNPEIYWSFSCRCKEGGIDYSLLGIADEDILTLRQKGIFPHNVIINLPYNNLILIPVFRYDLGNHLIRAVCTQTLHSKNIIKYYYNDNFTKTAMEASGSPVFCLDSEKRICLYGLHVAHGKAIDINSIMFHAKLLASNSY